MGDGVSRRLRGFDPSLPDIADFRRCRSILALLLFGAQQRDGPRSSSSSPVINGAGCPLRAVDIQW